MTFVDPSLPLQRAIERPLLHIIRQSTKIQETENPGSGKHQLSVREFCTEIGWPNDRIETLDARGESGSRGDRATFFEILRRVRTGRVGAVAFARDDRLGRTALESEELLRSAGEHQTLIITEGRIYNPASASDKLILGLMAQFAEYENAARTLWMMATRFALAKEGAYRVVLPTGLIAGSPDDPVFVEALTRAGLSSCLEGLEHHDAVSTRKGAKYFVLPFPNRDVYDACRLRMEWMLAYRSVDAVIERICNDTDYPRPGLIPTTKAIRRYHEGIEVNWIDVTHPNGLSVLRKWFCSPALYGIYRFSSPGLAEKSPDSDPNRYVVELEGAFPGYAAPVEWNRVKKVIAGDEKRRKWKEGSYTGPRAHLMTELRCGYRDDDGKICGNRLSAMYQPDGTYSYYSHRCRFEGHPTQHIYGPFIDSAIETCLLEVLDRDRIAAAMQSLQVSADSAKTRLHALAQEKGEIDRQMKGVRDAVIQAELDDAMDRKIVFTRRLDELIRAQQQVEARLDHARADLDDFQRLAALDRQRIIELGSDLSILLPLAREQNPDLLRALMKELIEVVRFERISGFACKIQLVFPAGHVIEQEIMTRRINASRAALEFAAGRLSAGDPPAEIARALNVAKPKNHRVPWDEERVLTAPVALRHQELPAIRKGTHLSVDSFAKRHGLNRAEIFIAAVHGHLGPGYYADGQLFLAPTDEELHRRFPQAARRHVASETGWSEEMVLTGSEACERTGLTKGAVLYRARRGSGAVKDATGRYWVFAKDFP